MTAPTSRPVVVGIDGSDSALAAARWGAVEARRRNAPLRLVTAFAWTRNRDLVVVTPEVGEQYRSDLQARAEQQLAEAITAAELAVPDRPVDGSVVVGSPIDALGEEARHAQLLVLGSRGRGGLTGLLIGSVAVALAPKSACPVVVVRAWRPRVDTPTRSADVRRPRSAGAHGRGRDHARELDREAIHCVVGDGVERERGTAGIARAPAPPRAGPSPHVDADPGPDRRCDPLHQPGRIGTNDPVACGPRALTSGGARRAA